MDECRLPGGCNTGDAKLTKGYRRALELAAENRLTTIAFRSIGTGIYGYPIEVAAKIAVGTVRAALPAVPSVREVTFCCFSAGDLAVYRRLLAA